MKMTVASLESVPINLKTQTIGLSYFFGYKTEFSPFQNTLKNLDPCDKMDLGLWDCLGRVKLVL